MTLLFPLYRINNRNEKTAVRNLVSTCIKTEIDKKRNKQTIKERGKEYECYDKQIQRLGNMISKGKRTVPPRCNLCVYLFQTAQTIDPIPIIKGVIRKTAPFSFNENIH